MRQRSYFQPVIMGVRSSANVNLAGDFGSPGQEVTIPPEGSGDILKPVKPSLEGRESEKASTITEMRKRKP